VARTVVVAGTSTGVGKTFVACRVIESLRAARRPVVARKPVESFEPGSGPRDGELLAEASGEALEQVCPAQWSYEIAMAPPMAARELGRAIPDTAELVEFCVVGVPASELLLVELAGGLRSPMSADGDAIDVACALTPDLVVLVGDFELGALNAMRLSIEALARVGIDAARVVVFANRFDANRRLHQLNADVLRGDGLFVTTDAKELADALDRRLFSAR
jgi:dethiobiotin synthetase